MFGNNIELYIAMDGSGSLKKVSFEKSKPSNNSRPIQIPPASPSVTIDFFKTPYEERVKVLQSQTRFYGPKNSIRRQVDHVQKAIVN